MTLSALGVVFGVAFFICGQAQTQGFERYFISTILGSKGAVIVSDRIQQTYTSRRKEDSKKPLSFVAIRNQLTAKYEEGVDEPMRLMNELMTLPNVGEAISASGWSKCG